MPREIMNEKEISHTSSNGTTFKSDRGDLRSGVKATYLWEIDDMKKLADFAEFGAWHAFWIHPNLNGFPGYDTINYSFEE